MNPKSGTHMNLQPGTHMNINSNNPTFAHSLLQKNQFNPYHNPIPKPKALNYNSGGGSSYRMCPNCGQEPIRFKENPFLTCKGGHQFYECPTCMDTRISNRKEEVLYCGLQHPYHICRMHRTPVEGIGRNSYECTCREKKYQSKPSLVQKFKPKNNNPLGTPFL